MPLLRANLIIFLCKLGKNCYCWKKMADFSRFYGKTKKNHKAMSTKYSKTPYNTVALSPRTLVSGI